MDGILKLQTLMLAAARCLGLGGVGGAEPSLPTSPAGKALRVWLDSFNSADADGLREYLEARYPTSQRSVDDWIGLRRHTGGFDLQAVEDASDSKLAVIVKARGWDEFARLTIEVESKPPYRATALTARLIPRPVDIAPPTRFTERQLLSILPDKLERAATDDHFSGALMIAKAGTPIYSAAFGCADRERKIPNTVETKFRIGSMNKLFTAVAVLQLVQGGRVDLRTRSALSSHYPNLDAGASSPLTPCSPIPAAQATYSAPTSWLIASRVSWRITSRCTANRVCCSSRAAAGTTATTVLCSWAS